MKLFRQTLVAGLLLLMPIVVLWLLITEVIEVMAIVADPIAELFPVESIGAFAVVNILAVLLLLAACLALGLIARSQRVQKLADTVESAILSRIPGYVLLKGFAGRLTPDKTAELIPVIYATDDMSRVGLLVDRLEDDRCVVYFPGAPNPWSGIIMIVPAERLEVLNVPAAAVFEHAEQLGKKTRQLFRQQGERSPQ